MNERSNLKSLIDDGTRACNPAAMKIGDYIEELERQQDEIINRANEIKIRLDALPGEDMSEELIGDSSYLLRLCNVTSRNAKLIDTLTKILEIL